MSNISDTATVTLNINGKQAKQMLDSLEKQMDVVRRKIQAMEAAGADPKAIEKKKVELNRLQRQYNDITYAVDGVGRAMSELDKVSLGELKKTLRTLQKQISGVEAGSETFNSLAEQIRTVKERISELNAEMAPQREEMSLWDRFKSWSEDSLPALLLIKEGYDMVLYSMRSLVSDFAELDQEMANVMKFSGLDESEVGKLNEMFSKMDTRTSIVDLNKLAQDAGRLGKSSVEAVGEFVNAADKVNVALDDLGDNATLSLSKLAGIFGYEGQYGTEQSLLKVGAVINELSQNCSASAPYIADFTERLGGVGQQAGMTIPQIMSFAAVLDANAQNLEASATALSQIIVRMMQEPEKYAKVAGLEVKTFTQLLKTDTNEALMIFLGNLNKAGGMDVMSKMFAAMGENGAHAISAMSTLAANIDMVRAQQDAANVAFREGTSITKEFEVQNNTVEAQQEKAMKSFQAMRVEMGQQLQPLMAHMMSSTSAMLRGLIVLMRYVAANKGSIMTLTAAILAYNVAANVAVIRTRSLAMWQGICTGAQLTWTAATKAGAVVMALMTGNVTKITAAWRAFSLAISASPLGLAISLIVAAAGAVTTYMYSAREARKEQERLNKEQEEFRKGLRDIEEGSAKYSANEISRLKSLYDVAVDENKAKEDRIAAVKTLQELYPDYFGQLSTEAVMTGRAADSYSKLTEQILRSARARAAADKIVEAELERDRIGLPLDEIEQKKRERILDLDRQERLLNSQINEFIRENSGKGVFEEYSITDWERFRSGITSGKIYNTFFKEQKMAIKRVKDEIAGLNKEADEIKKQQKVYQDAIDDLSKVSGITQEMIDNSRLKNMPEPIDQEAVTPNLDDGKQDYLNAALDKAKAEYEKLNALNETNYQKGTVSYRQYLEKKNQLDLEYVDKRLRLYDSLSHKDADKQETIAKTEEERAKLLLERAKVEAAIAKGITEDQIRELDRRLEEELKMLRRRFEEVGSEIFRNEGARSEAEFRIRRKHEEDIMSLYRQGSKEYEQMSANLRKLNDDWDMATRKKIADLYADYNDSLSLDRIEKERDLEMKLIRELYDQRKISVTQYEDWLIQARLKYAERTKKLLRDKQESKSTVVSGNLSVDIRSDGEREQARLNNLEVDRKGAERILEERYQKGLISYQQYVNGKRRIEQEYYRAAAGDRMDAIDRETKMVLDLGLTWVEMFANLRSSGKVSFEDISDAASAALASMSAGLEMYSQFASAEYEIRAAKVEKQYEREINSAKGNSAKVKKLEEQRDKELAAIKKEQSRKEFAVNVIKAVAQTAQNALMAYGAMVGIPVVGPALAAAAAATATAMGMIQVALLKKQQQAAEAQGYSEGGFTKPGRRDEPAGVVHAGEWVASQKLLASPVARPIIDALDYAQRNNTIGRLSANDVSRSVTAQARIADSIGSDKIMEAVALALDMTSRAVTGLNDRLNKPFVTVNSVTGDWGSKRANDEYERLIRNKSPRYKE